MKKITVFIGIMALALASARAWDNTGTTSGEFLKVIGSARSVGLGGSYAALDDVNNMFVNPALIGYGKCVSLGLNFIAFFQDVNYASLTGKYLINGVDGVSVGAIYLDSGPIAMTADSPDSTSTFTKRDYAIIGGYGREVGGLLDRTFKTDFLKGLYLGADLRYYNEGYGDFSYQGALLDIGVYYIMPFLKGLSAGFSLLNIRFASSDSAGAPFNIKIGARYDLDIFKMNKREKDFSFLADFEKTEGIAPLLAVGLEGHFFDVLSARLGYRFFHDTGWISAGLGVSYGDFTLSYSFSPYSDLGLDNQFSLSYALECPGGPVQTNLPERKEWFRINMNRDCYSLINKKDITFIFDIKKNKFVDHWDFRVMSEQSTVRLFEGSGEPPSNIIWNGRDEAGNMVPEGDYKAVMRLKYALNAGEEAFQEPIRVDGKAPSISITADKEMFSPDGDGYDDTLTFLPKAMDFCGITNWSILVTDKDKKSVRTFTGSGDVPPSLVWDGKDDQSNVIRQMAKYYYTLYAFDGCGNTNQAQSSVILKTDLYINKESNGILMIDLQGVEFDTALYSLRPVSYEILDRAVAVLSRPYVLKYKVRVEGHTDNRSGFDYNMELSHNRAKEVMNYLISHGVDTNRLSFVGYGYTRPRASNDTVEGRQRNRRVELILEASNTMNAIISNR